MNDPQIRAPWNDTGPPPLRVIRMPKHEIYNDDAVLEYPQSGERVRGRHNVQALRSQHPARPWGFVVRRIVGGGDLWVTEYVIVYDGRHVNTVSIMQFQAGKVARETQYFAEPFEPPAWRACLAVFVLVFRGDRRRIAPQRLASRFGQNRSHLGRK